MDTEMLFGGIVGAIIFGAIAFTYSFAWLFVAACIIIAGGASMK